MDRFEGFPAEVFGWFEGLERDNSREYVERTRATYDLVRGGMAAFLDELAGVFGGQVKVFRQHRDLRFTKDKSPFKTRTYGLLYDVPDQHTGLFAAISGDGLYAGTGYYQMSRDQLERYRQAVDDDAAGTELADQVARTRRAGLTVEGGGLQTAPRGYPRDHRRIELLRLTSVIAGRRWPPGDGISRRAALAGVTKAWRTAQPLVGWFDRHVGPAHTTD